MCGVVIILHRILDGGFADIIGPIAVPTGDEGHIVEIARVWHRVLLILQDLVDDSSDLISALCRHAAVEHVGEVVAIDGAIVQVSHLLGGITTSFSWDLSRIADKDDESRCSALVDASVVKVLHIGLNGVIVAASLCRGHHIHIEALLGLPIDPGLQGTDIVFRCDDNHVDGIGHQIGVVGVDIHDLAIVEHLAIDIVEVGAIGAEKHALGLGDVGTIEAHFHLDVVEHA